MTPAEEVLVGQIAWVRRVLAGAYKAARAENNRFLEQVALALLQATRQSHPKLKEVYERIHQGDQAAGADTVA